MRSEESTGSRWSAISRFYSVWDGEKLESFIKRMAWSDLDRSLCVGSGRQNWGLGGQGKKTGAGLGDAGATLRQSKEEEWVWGTIRDMMVVKSLGHQDEHLAVHWIMGIELKGRVGAGDRHGYCQNKIREQDWGWGITAGGWSPALEVGTSWEPSFFPLESKCQTQLLSPGPKSQIPIWGSWTCFRFWVTKDFINTY